MPPMKRALSPLALTLGLLVPGAGCTAIVVDGLLADDIPCGEPGDCAAGFVCTEGRCAASEGPGALPPTGTLVGAAGGEVEGPDGVRLSVPANAVPDGTAFTIERVSSTHVALGCAEASDFFRVTPAMDLNAAATIAIPVTACNDCVICAQGEDDGPWAPLDEPGVAPTGSAAGVLEKTGAVLVAGVPQ